MKTLIVSLFALFLSVPGFAQPFTLTVDGFRSTADEAKDYVVVTVDDCDKATLFQRAKNYFTVVYNSPQNVMSESGMDAISILGVENINCRLGGSGILTYRFSYKLICEFRDGRAKITPVWVDLGRENASYPIQSTGPFSGGIYRKNGELRDESAKDQIEQIINPLVSGLESALKSAGAQTSGDDW